ncbi:MAG TPA: glycosyltransferase family 4 protein [Verrucomicrobiae bacterium]|nr:glycosyltransferase family 4 protein [Verrucomicrobiae bacterium]
MKIAVVVPVEESVPPVKYGGTELVAYNLVEGLVKNGHEVHLFATGDSKTSGTLHAVFPEPVRVLAPDPSDSKLREAFKYVAIGRALEEILADEQFDIVHNHIGWRWLPFQNTYQAPTVTTLHGPLDSSYGKRVFEEYPDSKFVSISNDQRKKMPELPIEATVYNGIDVKRFEYVGTPGEYLAFLGRMSPEKGPKQAIQAALLAGERLVMAAKVDAVDQEYFKTEIEPLIDGEQIKFLGEVDHAGKVELLKNAKGLMALIQWDEPFGLFMAEAMACGTPVIAIPRGSVEELVVPEKTGIYVHSVEEAAEAIKRIHTIDRAACRKRAEENFSIESMVKGYEAVFEKLIAG